MLLWIVSHTVVELRIIKRKLTHCILVDSSTVKCGMSP